MPNHQIHDLFSRLFLGKSSRRTDHIIDYPAGNPWPHMKNGQMVFEPMGPNHRAFGHDPLSAMLIGLIAGEGPEVGLTHYLTDMAFDGLEKIANGVQKQHQPADYPDQVRAKNQIRQLLKSQGFKDTEIETMLAAGDSQTALLKQLNAFVDAIFPQGQHVNQGRKRKRSL